MYFFERHNIKRKNKFVFNGNDLSNIVVVESIKRQLLPQIQNNAIYIPGKIGREFQSNNLDLRVITLTLRFIEDTYEDVQKKITELAGHLYTKEPKKLELYDTDLFNYAIISQALELQKINSTGSCELIFECYDPLNYGETKTAVLEEESIISINGTYPISGIINLTTKQSDYFKITLNDGLFIQLDTMINANQNIIIDLNEQKITVNGNLIQDKINLNSDFFKLVPGNNKITIYGATGNIVYNEGWI